MLTGAVASAQPTVKRVKYHVSCPTCAIEFTPVATITGPSDSVGIAEHSFLDRDSQGRFFAIGDNNQILVYDQAGRFLKGLGRRGNGPGEFNGGGPLGGIIDVVIGRGDSVFIFHPPKVTVYSPQLEFVRVSRLPVISLGSIYPLVDGTWLVGGANYTPEHPGRTGFVVNSDGAIVRSLEIQRTVVSTGGRRTSVPQFKLSPDRRSLWVKANGPRYSLDQWSTDGRELYSLVIDDVPYLPEPKRVTRRSASGGVFQSEVGGNLTITGIDTLGQVWTWGKAPGAVNGVLEVADQRTGEIRASQKAIVPVWLLRSGELAYTPTTDNDGFLRFVVSRYRIVRR